MAGDVFARLRKAIELDQNEGTAYPYWMIVDPREAGWVDEDGKWHPECEADERWPSPHLVASQMTGPFFSRETAQQYLEDKSHRFGEKAVVFCMSGHQSREYRDLVDGSKETMISRSSADLIERLRAEGRPARMVNDASGASEEFKKELARQRLLLDVSEEFHRDFTAAEIENDELSRRLGCSPERLKNVLAGNGDMTFRTLADIARILGKRARVFLVDDDYTDVED